MLLEAQRCRRAGCRKHQKFPLATPQTPKMELERSVISTKMPLRCLLMTGVWIPQKAELLGFQQIPNLFGGVAFGEANA